MRAAVELEKLGERQIWIDCDVIEADGGTRTASITGAFIALSLAVKKLMASNKLTQNPIRSHVAAVSDGIVGGVPMLDLNYVEDSGADVDFNLVMTDRDEFVEVPVRRSLPLTAPRSTFWNPTNSAFGS
jgi:ribonuclease PH